MKKSIKTNPSTKTSAQIRWWHVVIVVILIAALFFLLEKMKAGYQNGAVMPTASDSPPQMQKGENYSHQIYTTSRTLPPVKKPGRTPRKHLSGTVAIIVDDMGSSLHEARELLAINMPITFSLIPGLPKVKGVADLAAAAGQQVMVHLPMEPQGYPERRLEANGLLVEHSENEITERTVALLNSVPQAKGANNHMGSRFSEHEEKMLPVLKVLQGRGQFFIDSMTTPRSKGAAIAESLGMRFAARNVFLDNEQDVSAIKKQLYAAAEMARKKGGVIAICHPHPATIAALKETLPELQRAGITFVSAGELVR